MTLKGGGGISTELSYVYKPQRTYKSSVTMPGNTNRDILQSGLDLSRQQRGFYFLILFCLGSSMLFSGQEWDSNYFEAAI
jgi:hypothetical protein